MTDPRRTPAGVPTGGQFTTSPRPEGALALASPNQVAIDAAVAEAKRTGRFVPVLGIGHDEVDPGQHGSSCGDTSLGVEPSRRRTWATGSDDEPFATVTETFYVIGRRDGENHDLDYDAWNEARAEVDAGTIRDDGFSARIHYGVERQTDWIAHTDADDPGGTEVRSECAYAAGSAISYTTLERAEGAARGSARHINWERDYAPENWK